MSLQKKSLQPGGWGSGFKAITASLDQTALTVAEV